MNQNPPTKEKGPFLVLTAIFDPERIKVEGVNGRNIGGHNILNINNIRQFVGGVGSVLADREKNKKLQKCKVTDQKIFLADW